MASTKQEIRDLVSSNIPDNTSGLITPAKHREVLLEVINTMASLAASEPTQTSLSEFIHSALHNYTGGLQINGAPVQVFNTIVVVRSESDLPAVVNVGGVDIHRLDEKEYIIDGDVTIANPIGWPGANKTATITALNRSILTYTGANALFYDPDAQGNIEVSGLTDFKAPNGSMWNPTAVTGSFSFQSSGEADRFSTCLSLGTVNCNGLSQFNIFFGTLSNFNQGLIVNNPAFFEINSAFVFGNNQVGCTYFTVQGASTIGSINFDTLTVGNGTNETLFDLNTNIQSGIDAVNIRSCSQEGGINGTIFAAGSLTEKDNKVLSVGNSILADTIPGGLLSLTGNATATVITAQNDPTLVAGTWVVQGESQFTGTTGGRLTYGDERGLTRDLDAVLSVQPATGVGIGIRAYIAKNGTEIVASGQSTTADNDKSSLITLTWRDELVSGDYYELFVENESNDNNIIVVDATLRIP